MTEQQTRPVESPRATALTAYEPRDLGELRQFAQEVTATQLVPEKYRGKPADAMVAMMYGKETANLGPLASLQYVAVINGRPAFYGDALPGIAFNKGLVVDMEETLEGEPMSLGWTAICVVTRANGTKVTQRFSVADAKRAGLWDKAGPWKQYPQRMMQWRARSWAIRDAAPHLLFGPTYEELRDIENYVGPDNARDVSPASKTPTAAERRAAMRAAELVEVVTFDGEPRMILPGEVEQFLRDEAGASGSGAMAQEFVEANRRHLERFGLLPEEDHDTGEAVEPARQSGRRVPPDAGGRTGHFHAGRPAPACWRPCDGAAQRQRRRRPSSHDRAAWRQEDDRSARRDEAAARGRLPSTHDGRWLLRVARRQRGAAPAQREGARVGGRGR